MSAYGSRKQPKPLRHETDAERATRLVMQAHVSEMNRQTKLAHRPDAAERIAAAQAKRERKEIRRAINAVIIYQSEPWHCYV